ncbi:flagellar modification protein B, partial [Campylobacter coli]
PPAPLRCSLDIKKEYESLVENNNPNLHTAVHARRNPYVNFGEKQNNKVVKSKEGNFTTRQSSPKCYEMNASIYIFKRDYLLANDSVFGKNTGLFVMDERTVFDIDSELDFKIVEFLISLKNLSTKDF